MEPLLKKNDKKLFYDYLDKAKIYFEYGSGGSTYQANSRSNIQKIYSVESDKEWHNKLKNIIKTNKVQYIYNEMNTLPNSWGYPGDNCSDLEKINYSDQIKKLSKEEQNNIDLVLIDGRFRVACCLKLFDIVNNDCVIIFDDFFPRKNYNIVLNYYNIIDKTIDNNMVILKKKKGINLIPKELIKQYELIPN
jgi:hypothetical protein